MSGTSSLERRLADHYASEAPARAPDRVLLASLATIETSQQRRALLVPRRFTPMTTYSRLAAAAVAVIAVGAIAVWQLAPPANPSGGGASPSPSAVPTPRPTSTPAPTPVPTGVAGTASEFIRPFSFVLPGVPRFDHITTGDRSFEARVPAWHDAGHNGGLIVEAVGGGRVDPCDRASAERSLEAGPQAVMDYLRSIPQMAVSGESSTTVDGRPARQATVVAKPTTECPSVWAWFDAGEAFIDGTTLRLVAFDVDGEHVVVTIYGEAGNPEWPAMADGIIGSFRF